MKKWHFKPFKMFKKKNVLRNFINTKKNFFSKFLCLKKYFLLQFFAKRLNNITRYDSLTHKLQKKLIT